MCLRFSAKPAGEGRVKNDLYAVAWFWARVCAAWTAAAKKAWGLKPASGLRVCAGAKPPHAACGGVPPYRLCRYGKPNPPRREGLGGLRPGCGCIAAIKKSSKYKNRGGTPIFILYFLRRISQTLASFTHSSPLNALISSLLSLITESLIKVT